jgi:alanyl-tRNA synthetase
LYVTVFEGDKSDDLSADNEAAAFWKDHVDEERILFCDKKDNFWEMGETGPCGPCSEIHMDLRPEGERAKADGKELVNKDHDQVIELWNLVFIQYNRKADGSLENLPEKHVDTGMGLERVTRAIHLKSSNYDTDLFMDTIRKLEEISGKQYGKNEQLDIAFRVIADHIRAVSFTIADGQLPSNEKAGYVVRRILRRAIRYGYSFLDLEQPFIYRLVKVLLHSFGSVFPGLQEQKDFVAKVIEQEEKSFLNTLNKGLKLFDKYSKAGKEDVSGIHAFELYDTYGFPIDLTELLAREKGIGVDLDGFQVELQKQKERSRADAQKTSGDWNVLQEDEKEEFIGYDQLEANVKITRYREVEAKGKKYFHLVFNYTPFYAESGGQVGDKGVLLGTENEEKISVVDTQKENDLIIQITEKLPQNSTQVFVAKVNHEKRKLTTYNHSATHLLHAALKEVLGEHVNQKGSLVNDKYLRFDFSHFQKVSEEELQRIEQMVNDKIWQAITLDEKRDVPFQQAIEYGATALFGEKYGDVVRVITFDPNYSIELCGGTHVKNTAHIGLFKITSESAVAAGVRRIEAITHTAARKQLKEQTALLEEVRAMLGNPQQVTKGIESLKKENEKLKEQVQAYEAAQLEGVKNNLTSSVALVGGVNTLVAGIEVANAGLVKDLAFQLNNEIDNLFAVLVANAGGKPNITIIMADVLVKERGLNAGQLVRDWAKAIRGGGGGQPFFAQAGGSDLSGLEQALDLARNFVATTF